MTETGTATQRRRRGKGMRTDEMHKKYPSLVQLAGQSPDRSSEVAWVAAFRARPDAMHALLADFIKQVHAKPGRIGQRPMPKEAEVDLQSLIYGEENDLPLTEVLPKLMRVSERAFCQRVFMSRQQFRRLLAGTYHPDVNELRRIAAALDKQPVFLVEYRKAMVMSAFVNLINERPGIATKLYRQYLETRFGES